MSLMYWEKIDGLYCKQGKVGPLSMSDDILVNLANMVGVEEFEFGGCEAPTHLITGIPDSLKVLRLDNWADVTEGVARELMVKGVRCDFPGGACPAWVCSPYKAGGGKYCWTWTDPKHGMHEYTEADEE